MYEVAHSNALDEYLASVGARDAVEQKEKRSLKKFAASSAWKWIKSCMNEIDTLMNPPWPSWAKLSTLASQDGIPERWIARFQSEEMPMESIDTKNGLFYAVVVGVLGILAINSWIYALCWILSWPAIVRCIIYSYSHCIVSLSRHWINQALQEYSQIHDTCSSALAAFEIASSEALHSIKAAELVHRGYLLDTILPPILRLESNRTKSTKDMRCLKLRITLREAYLHLFDESHAIDLIADENDTQTTPSLLLLSLNNSHKTLLNHLQSDLNKVLSINAETLHKESTHLHRLKCRLEAMTQLVQQTTHPLPVEHENSSQLPNLRQHSPKVLQLVELSHRLKVTITSIEVLLQSYQQELLNGDQTGQDNIVHDQVKKLLQDAHLQYENWTTAFQSKEKVPVVQPHDHENAVPNEPERQESIPLLHKSPEEESVTQVFTALSTGYTKDDNDDKAIDPAQAHTIRTFNVVVDELQNVLDRRVLPPERVKGDDSAAPKVEAPLQVYNYDQSNRPIAAMPSLNLELKKAFQAFPEECIIGSSDSEEE